MNAIETAEYTLRQSGLPSYAELTAQRDELLTAMRKLAAQLLAPDLSNAGVMAMYEQARAALARAGKEGAK